MQSISELNDTNIKKLCRICLTINTKAMISIFDEIEQMENDENVKIYICDMLMAVVATELDRRESLPTSICMNCLRLTQLLFNFRKQFNKSQTILLEYLTEKKDKVVDAETSPNKDNNVLNKTFSVKNSIDTEKYLNENGCESISIENDVRELSKLSSSDHLLNATIKLEFYDEVINSDVENNTEKEHKVIGTKQNTNQDIDDFNKKPQTKKSINKEKSLNENACENIIINDIPELSNPSSSNDLLNASIKVEFVECEETPSPKVNNNKEENVLACYLCDESFENDTVYLAHMKQHTDGKCVCNVCNKHFKHPMHLTVHLRRHIIAKRYSCKICGKDYKHSKSLIVHMRLHAGQAPLSCSVCGKGFRNSSSLKLHMKTHTQEKLYMCNICGEATATLSHLVRHVREHNGEKPYKCIICSKDFSASSMLKRHSIVHTGLIPYSCKVCKRSFSRKSTLRNHEKIHANKIPDERQVVKCIENFDRSGNSDDILLPTTINGRHLILPNMGMVINDFSEESKFDVTDDLLVQQQSSIHIKTEKRLGMRYKIRTGKRGRPKKEFRHFPIKNQDSFKEDNDCSELVLEEESKFYGIDNLVQQQSAVEPSKFDDTDELPAQHQSSVYTKTVKRALGMRYKIRTGKRGRPKKEFRLFPTTSQDSFKEENIL